MSIHPMQQEMESDGIFPAEQIIPDGIFRRIDDANGKPKNQYIFAVCSGHGGFYGHWITLRDGKNWSIKHETEFTPEERKAYAVQMQQAREDRARAEEERHRECRERSLKIWNQSPLADADHTCSKYKLSKRWVTYGGLDWAVQAHKAAKNDTS